MGQSSRRPGRWGLMTALALVVGVLSVSTTAGAQVVGAGASPGRAAYRPASQWNNGPFFTTPHWDPYAPHRAVSTGLITSTPVRPPYSNHPRGVYSTYYPERGALFPYAEGFSPYSGFAGWYTQEHGFTPTRDQVVQARTMFFRSAPRPPAGVLPPLPPAAATQPVTLTPLPRAPVPPPSRVPVYRSSVAGG